MKFSAKKVLSAGLATLGLSMLAACEVQELKLDSPTNLAYDQEEQIFSWDKVDGAYNYFVEYRIYDSKYFEDEEKNYIKFETTDNQINVVLDPETADGDKITFSVYAQKHGVISYTSSLESIIEGKNHEDYLNAYTNLRFSFDKLLQNQNIKDKNLVYKQLLQLDDDNYNTKKLTAKFLATDENDVEYMIMAEMDYSNFEWDNPGGYIQSTALITNVNKYKWKLVGCFELANQSSYEGFEKYIPAFRGENAIGAYYADNVDFSNFWNYTSVPYKTQDGWEFLIFQELYYIYNYINVTPKLDGVIMADFVVKIPNREDLQTPEDVLNYYNNISIINGIIPVNKQPEAASMRLGIRRHLEYMQKNFEGVDFLNDMKLNSQKEYNHTLINSQDGKYTFVLPETRKTPVTDMVKKSDAEITF